ncbi:HEPN domain-containing protein [uncultured Thiodictyon sp.]|uniref:HEPN domain-containing protein n=1 Tax=uncultured Thiodictyon sp. TaxID=1846217 RepID=UPI0025F07E1A|nr:HEPN domain-containing protein [uncultured Thiodictyon sp.]
MRQPDDPEVNDWLQKVAEDYRVAQVLAESAEPLDDAICFHCQQAAEKLLKALLVAAGARPPRTHDLEELASLLPSSQPLPAEIADACAYLSELAVIPRYPVHVDLRSPGRAGRARRELDKTIDWAEKTFGWLVPRRPSASNAARG